MMFKNEVYLVTFACICLCCHGSTLKCGKRYRFIKHINEDGGYCEKCPKCDGGGFFKNTSVERQWDDNHGYLQCWPCVPCPEGTYRESGKPNGCNLCMKSCGSFNRYESLPCGGSSPGHCGACYQGLTPETNEPESYCIDPESEGYKISTAKTKILSANAENFEEEHVDDVEEPNSLTIFLIGATSILVSIAVVVGICYFRDEIKTRCTRISDPASAYGSTESSKKMISSIESGINPAYTSVKSHKDNDKDLETDGQPRVPPPRGELPTIVSLESLEALGYVDLPTPEFPVYKLKPDDEFSKNCIRHVSKTVSGEKQRKAFFEHLGVARYNYEPEEELWEKGKQWHKDYVYNVLKQWVQSNDDASFHELCSALYKANFTDITDKLLDDYHNRTSLVNNDGRSSEVKYIVESKLDTERARVHQLGKAQRSKEYLAMKPADRAYTCTSSDVSKTSVCEYVQSDDVDSDDMLWSL